MVQLTHLDPWHSEGHWLYGCLGEHHSYSYLYITHVALRLGQEGQTLQAGNNQEGSKRSQALNHCRTLAVV